MKDLIIIVFFLTALAGIANGQDKTKTPTDEKPAKEVDNYTVQYLIIFNNNGEVLLQKKKRDGTPWQFAQIKANP